MEKIKDWNYEVIKKIGRGDFGEVYKCLNLETNQTVAIKMITIHNELEGVPSCIISQVSLLKELEHENIIRLLDVLSSGKYIYLVFEYLDLDLHSFIRKQKTTLDSPVIKTILMQTLAGLAYCHSLKVLHRDLKPSNVLIDLESRRVKIANFRLATSFGVPQKQYSYTVVESPYKAPERRVFSSEYSTPFDVWAVGCIFAEMLTGKPLLPHGKDHLSLIVSLLGKPIIETLPASPGVTFLSELLDSYPQCEPNLPQMFPGRQPSGDDLLSQMLWLDPEHRITANGALRHKYFLLHKYLRDDEEVTFTIPPSSRRASVKKFLKRNLKIASRK